MDIEEIAFYSKRKGIDLVSTGSFTHQKHLKKIKDIFSKQDSKLEFYKYKDVYFLPTTEINNVFEDDKKIKHRIHNLIIFEDILMCEQFNDEVKNISSLGTDGRLWVRLDLKETIDLIENISKKFLFIPAHIWTPWYGLLGEKNGFNNLDEAFGEKKHKIYAIETGLSSDPPMNWRCSFLNNLSLVSFSDAHSPENIAREATVIELKKPNYDYFFDAIKNKKIKKTIEFFPQEGKYYSSGCRKCQILLDKYQERCPKCNKKIAKGVLDRIDEIADRKKDFKPKNASDFVSIIPLKKIIANILNKNEKTKAVEIEYERLIQKFKSELNILLEEKISNLASYNNRLADAISKMRKKDLKIVPGYDGVFGKIQIQ
jgi:uncharacterized protein (TIGR00375 family)